MSPDGRKRRLAHALVACTLACYALVACAGSDERGGSTLNATPASAASVSAYTFLMGPDVKVAGDYCGLAGSVTREWEALYHLIDAGEEHLLRIVVRSALTPEGRVLGVVGLYKLGRLNREDATRALGMMDVTVEGCSGCMGMTSPASEFTFLFRDFDNAIELPGAVRTQSAPPADAGAEPTDAGELGEQ